MSTHDPRDERLESALRQALQRDAAQVRPADRLDAVLAGSTSGRTGREAQQGRARVVSAWPLLAAAVTIVAVIVSALLLRGSSQANLPAAPATSSRSDLSSEPVPAPSSPRGTSSFAAPWPSSQGQAVAVYRAFFPSSGMATTRPTRAMQIDRTWEHYVLPGAQGADRAGRLGALVAASLHWDQAAFPPVWTTNDVATVDVQGDLVTVLMNAQRQALSREQARYAAVSVLLTIQADQGSTAQVRFMTADGGEVAPGLASGQVVTRPSADELASMLSPVWIDDPYPARQVPVGQPVTVKGWPACSRGPCSGGSPTAATRTIRAAAPRRPGSVPPTGASTRSPSLPMVRAA